MAAKPSAGYSFQSGLLMGSLCGYEAREADFERLVLWRIFKCCRQPKRTVHTNQIISFFDSYLSLDNTEKEELISRLSERKIKRKQFILQENDVCRHFTFINEGCFKMYAVDENGYEHNLQFAVENDWIADISSLHKEHPSQLYIEAIEVSSILQISKADLWFLYTHYPKFDRNFRVVIENKFIELQDRVLQNISSPAQERYKKFLAQYPTLANRLPNTQIASYLGITPEFLSKIRAERL